MRWHPLLLCGAAFVAALLFVPQAALAQDAGPPFELRWKLAPGDELRYRVVSDQTARQHVMEKVFDTAQKETIEYQLTAQERTPDGNLRLTCRYDRVALALNQLILGEMAWDSAKPEDAKDRELPNVRPYAALLGRSFLMTLRPDGSIPKGGIKGYDEIRDAVLEPVADQPFANSAIAPAFSDEAIRSSFERVFRLGPGEAVQPGATWKHAFTQPVALMGELRYQVDYQLVALEGEPGRRIAHVTYTVSITAPEPNGSAEAEPATASEAMRVVLTEGGGQGEARFAIDQGRLLQSRTEVFMDVSTAMVDSLGPSGGPGERAVRSEVRQTITLDWLP
ncbi:MAG: DUF6263 family protein [Planctomycetota bacterium]